MSVHVTTILFTLGIAFGVTLGIVSPYSTELAMFFLFLAVCQATLYVLSKRKNRRSTLALLFCVISAGTVLGIVRTQFVIEKPPFVCEEKCTVTGEVISFVERRETFQLFDVRLKDKQAAYVRVRSQLYPEVRKGDVVTLSGTIKIPTTVYPHNGEASFDYSAYLRLRGVGSELYYPTLLVSQERKDSLAVSLYDFNMEMRQRVSHLLPGVEGDLASGMLLGNVSFEEKVKEQFRVAGLSHIVVLSGFNVTILIMFVLFLLRPLPLIVRTSSAFLFVVLFIVMVSGGVSIVRAGLMSVISLYALFLGREYVARQALILSLVFIIMYSPENLLYDASLHLSFLATAGIVYGYEKIYRTLHRLPRFLRETCSGTLCAYVATLPYLLYTFGTMSPYALIANILAVPLVPLGMFLTVVSIVTSFVSTALSTLFSFATAFVLGAVIEVSRIVSELPLSSLSWQLSFSQMLAGYAMLLLLFLMIRDKNETTETKDEEILSPVLRF